MRSIYNWFFLLLIFLQGISCAVPVPKPAVNTASGDTLSLGYAKAFQLIDYQDFIFLKIIDPASSMVLQELRIPKSAVADPVTFTMSESHRIACLSTTHASMIAAIGAGQEIVSMAFSDRVMDPEVLSFIQDGKIADLGSESGVDMELLVQSRPDVFFIYPYESGALDKYTELGISCIQIAEYLETHPLGRAEWIRLFGILLGREAEANKLFSEIESRYLDAKNLAFMRSNIPSVFTGSQYQGMWYAPSGDSFIATFLRDAGANYVFASSKGQDNLTIDMEEMIEQAHDADFWGKVIFEDSLPAAEIMLGSDMRLQSFKSFREKQLFVCNASSSDYFGRGVIEPDEILKDLIRIFHPGVFSDRTPKYFEKWE